jgi:zinc-ribbon domain
MTFCSNCGQQLNIGTEKFCPNCGQDLKVGGAVSANRDPSINIGNTQGDVMGVGFSGDGNIIGKNITVGSVGIGEQQLQKIPKEYADSLKAFTDAINQQFKANNVPSDKVAEVQTNVNEFSKELEGVKPGQDPGIVKKSNLKTKLINIAKAALTILPKTLPVILSAFTPLQPFSQLIGEDTQVLVQAVQKET